MPQLHSVVGRKTFLIALESDFRSIEPDLLYEFLPIVWAKFLRIDTMVLIWSLS